MTTKHTPGPWRVNTDTAKRRIFSDHGMVATVEGHGGINRHGTPEADSHLIAAAPDMAEALRGLLDDKYLADPINAERMAQARAALAKAGL